MNLIRLLKLKKINDDIKLSKEEIFIISLFDKLEKYQEYYYVLNKQHGFSFNSYYGIKHIFFYINLNEQSFKCSYCNVVLNMSNEFKLDIHTCYSIITNLVKYKLFNESVDVEFGL